MKPQKRRAKAERYMSSVIGKGATITKASHKADSPAISIRISKTLMGLFAVVIV